MITLAWIVCAKGSTIDRQSGAISIFEVMNGIQVESFPLVIPQVSVIAALRRNEGDPEKGSGILRISHNGQKMFDGPVNFDFQLGLATQLVITINGVLVPGPGIITFDLMINKKRLGSFILDVQGNTPAVIDGGVRAALIPVATQQGLSRKKKTAKRSISGKGRTKRKK